MNDTPTDQEPAANDPWPRTYRHRAVPSCLLRHHDFGAEPDRHDRVPCEFSRDNGETWEWKPWRREPDPKFWEYVAPAVTGWYVSRYSEKVYYVEDGADDINTYKATSYDTFGERLHAIVELDWLERLDRAPAWVAESDRK